ncbi:MAG: hypothetical protein H6746_01730 [Deltaproteobacteria bacterium]|nr:hypothetical protein [Deltaproteobacteria bacterium]
MTVDVLTKVLIERSLREVAAYAGDPDKAPAWYVKNALLESEERSP